MIADFTEKYMDDLVVRLTHHSNALENNTLTLNETISIVLYQTAPNGKSLSEIYETDNHARALKLMIEKIHEQEVITHKTLLDLHYVLMDRLDATRGQFKNNENAIVGADFQTAHPNDVPQLIDSWCYDLNFKLNNDNADLEFISEVIAQKHIEFERIHPFSDGNGRMGRLLMNYSLLERGFPPFVILKQEKLEYINALTNQNTSDLASKLKYSVSQEKERARKFGVVFNRPEINVNE
ncbi:MAG: Fic family protein [Erysipelothrix sp.]|nr:Fic family protein [Erysipelothrix sp.]